MAWLDTWLARNFDSAQPTRTITDLAAAQPDGPTPDVVSLREQIAQCERKLASYRAALDAGADPAVVGHRLAKGAAWLATGGRN